MIAPTVGRIVWYRPGANEILPTQDTDPLAAIVVAVHSDRQVSLTVFDVTGRSHARPFVPLVQEGDAYANAEPYCEWMPFQKGQAKAQDAAKGDFVVTPLTTDRNPFYSGPASHGGRPV